MTLPLIGITTVRTTDSNGRIYDGLSQAYSTAIALAGGIPVLIPQSTIETANDLTPLHSLYQRLDGVLLPGGGDVHPDYYGEAVSDVDRGISTLRDAIELPLVRWAYEDDLPLLGICRGHQVMNVALGGSLHHDVQLFQGEGAFLSHDADSMTERERLMHTVQIESSSRLFGALGADGQSLAVNSLHHQAVNRLAPVLVASAVADDCIIEGIEAPQARFFMGVQWHPEALVHSVPQMRQLFASFVAACATKTSAGR